MEIDTPEGSKRLIKELQKISDQGHGDVPVLYKAYYYEDVRWVELYDEEDGKYILLDTST